MIPLEKFVIREAIKMSEREEQTDAEAICIKLAFEELKAEQENE